MPERCEREDYRQRIVPSASAERNSASEEWGTSSQIQEESHSASTRRCSYGGAFFLEEVCGASDRFARSTVRRSGAAGELRLSKEKDGQLERRSVHW